MSEPTVRPFPVDPRDPLDEEGGDSVRQEARQFRPPRATPAPDQGLPEQPGPSLGETFGASLRVASATRSIFDVYNRKEFEPDPNFSFTGLPSETQKELFLGIPVGVQDEFKNEMKMATSLEHARAIRDRFERSLQARETLDEAGWMGFASTLGVGLLDPVGIALGAGPARAAIAAGRLTRMQSALRTGGGFAGALAAEEGLIASADPLTGPADIAIAGAVGAGLGGVIGAATARGTARVNAMDRATRALEDRAMNGVADPVRELDAARAEVRRLEEAAEADPEDWLVESQLSIARSEVDRLNQTLPQPETPVSGRTPDPDPPVTETKITVGGTNREVMEAIAASGPSGVTTKSLQEALGGKARGTVTKAVTRLRELGVPVRSVERTDPATGSRIKVWTVDDADQFVAPGDGATGTRTIAYQEVARPPEQRLYYAQPQGTPRPPEEPPVRSRSVGAAENLERIWPGARPPLTTKGGKDIVDELEARAPAAEDVHWSFPDMSTQVIRGPMKAAAGLMDLLTPSSTGFWKNSGRAQELTAQDIQTNVWTTTMGRLNVARSQAFAKWAEESKGMNAAQRLFSIQARDEFEELVADAVRRGQADNPHVARVAEETREVHEKLLQLRKEAGERGFEDVEFNPNYLLRRYSLDKIRKVEAEIGTRRLAQFMGEALVRGTQKSGGKPIDLTTAVEISARVLKSIKEGRYGIQEVPGGDLFAPAKELYEELKDVLPEGFTVEDLSDALNGFTRRSGDGGAAGRAQSSRWRARFWEQYQENIGGKRYFFTDLLENNAMLLTQEYARDASGRIALAQMGFPDDQTWQRTIRAIKARAAEDGVTPEKVEEITDTLETVKKLIAGKPVHDIKKFHRLRTAARLLRSYNFMRVMGMVGFAQFAEVGNILSYGGLRAAMKHAPIFKNVWKRAQDGSLSDEFLDELEASLGIGMDRALHDPFGRYADGFMEPETARITRWDRRAQIGERITADWSMMQPINMAMERWAASAMSQRIADAALKGDKTFLNANRLRSLGFDDDNLERVFAQIKKHAKFEEGGLTGRKIAKLNLDNWDDGIARRDFVVNVQRYVRRAVQKQDAGDLPKWMTTEMGKVIFQFRTFALVSYNKQLMHGVRHKDAVFGTAFLTSTLMGALGYIGMTLTKGVGRDDQQEYLKERLSLMNIAAGAFYRSSFSSLTPTLIDTALFFVPGLDPMFDFARSTVQASDILFGNPTGDLLDSFVSGARGLGEVDMERAVGGFRRSLLFQNSFGVNQALNILESGVPDSDDAD